MKLVELNVLPPKAAREVFARCCGARSWAEAMAGARPFTDRAALHAAADRAARSLTRKTHLPRRDIFVYPLTTASSRPVLILKIV